MAEQQKGQWDGGRFLKTLAYFGVVPFIGNISWIQNLWGGGTKKRQEKQNIILVVGATGGVGKRVVQRLQQQGIKVRLIFAQGDTIKGQVSRDDIAELCIQALTEPKACNTIFEVKAEQNSQVSANGNQLFSKLKPD